MNINRVTRKVTVAEGQEPSKPTKYQALLSKKLKHQKSLLFFCEQIGQLI